MVCMSPSPFPAVTRNSKGPELQKAQFLRSYKRQLVTLTSLLSIRSQSLIAPTRQPPPAAVESMHHGIRHHASRDSQSRSRRDGARQYSTSHRLHSTSSSSSTTAVADQATTIAPLWNPDSSRQQSPSDSESKLQQAAVTVGSTLPHKQGGAACRASREMHLHSLHRRPPWLRPPRSKLGW
jgi:hypothetical protein